jgi:hypothetical protein
LFAALLVLGWMLLAPDAAARPWPRAAALALGAAPAIILIAPFIHVLFGLLIRIDSFVRAPVGSGAIALAALALGSLLLAFQFLAGSRRWLLPGAAALVGLLTISVASVASNFDADHPRPDSIAYVLDADTGAATWVSADGRLDAWTRQFFPSGAAPGGFVAMPNSNPDQVWPAWIAPAPPVVLAAPAVTVLEDAAPANLRSLRLRLTSPRGASNLYLDIRAAGDVVAATLDGKPLDLSAWPADGRARFRLAYHALPTEGIEVGLTVAAAGPISIRVEDRSNGLPTIPGMTIAPRPADTMPAPFELADPTIVARSLIIDG